jgi:hypothetical protein
MRRRLSSAAARWSQQIWLTHLRDCDVALLEHDWHKAVSTSEAGLQTVSAPPAAQRVLFNSSGIALHFLGDHAAAKLQLDRALSIALDAAMQGAASDDYTDLGGVLSDIAANHICRGELDDARTALKRGQYMVKRAYRPSHSANACLTCVQALLHEADGDPLAASAAHQEAHRLLLLLRSPPPTASSPIGNSVGAAHADRWQGDWLHACRSGSTRSLLNAGAAPAAATLANADLVEDRLATLEGPTRGRMRALATVVALECERQRGDAASFALQRDATLTTLRAAAAEFAEALGETHPDTLVAQANVAVAEAATRASTPPSGGLQQEAVA